MSEQNYVGIEPKHCNECGKDYTPVVCSDECPHNKIDVTEWQAREQDESFRLTLSPKRFIREITTAHNTENEWFEEGKRVQLEQDKIVLAKAKQHYEQKDKGRNWSNCPYWSQCEDENKHIMTYCDIQCSNPLKQKRLDRPELREKIKAVLRTKHPGPTEWIEEDADQILALILDIEKTKERNKNVR